MTPEKQAEINDILYGYEADGEPDYLAIMCRELFTSLVDVEAERDALRAKVTELREGMKPFAFTDKYGREFPAELLNRTAKLLAKTEGA